MILCMGNLSATDQSINVQYLQKIYRYLNSIGPVEVCETNTKQTFAPGTFASGETLTVVARSFTPCSQNIYLL